MGQGVLDVPAPLLEEIAKRVGTPTYVYVAADIRAQVDRLKRTLRGIPHRIHYSVKANSNLAILALVRRLDVGVDIVSGGELARVLSAGFDRGDIVFSGVGKTSGELSRAIEAGVGLINLESEDELEVVAETANTVGRDVTVGIRVNPDVATATHPYTQTGAAGMKFGVPVEQVPRLAEQIGSASRLRLTSVGMHIGSQITSAESYAEGVARLRAVVERLRAGGVVTLTTVNVGGGMAIPSGGSKGLDLALFAAAVAPVAVDTGLTLLVEPGRFLIGNAGILITRVLYCKQSGGRTFVIVDAGMNDFCRPSYYGAEHPITVVGRDGVMTDASGAVDVVGPICESGDYLGLDRTLEEPVLGRLLAVHGAGAYGFAMSSTYNSRPRAAEVLIDGDRAGVIRVREKVEDLWRGEFMEPAWLPLDETRP